MAPFRVIYIFCSFSILIFNLQKANCKIVKGELITRSNWQFLARFCFVSLVGRFEYEIEFPAAMAPVNLLLYYDSPKQWPAVYGTNKTCREKENVLSRENGQIVVLRNVKQDYAYTGCKLITNISMIRCKSERRFESRRERWWFVAISKCNSKKGLTVRYNIHMTNHKDYFFKKHYSADEAGILETNMAFTIIYYITFVATCISARFMHSRHLLHQTFKLFMISVFCKFMGLLLLTIAYGSYGRDGEGSPKVKLAGQVLEAMSTITFLLLLILIAKGYTVTRGRLKGFTSAIISVFMTIYCVCYSALFIYEQKVFDPGLVLYIYECLAGYLIIVLRVVAWGFFVFSTILTMIRYPAKALFYSKIFLIYTAWFLSAPVIVLIATFILGKWMREKIINGVEHGVMWIAHVVFLIITRPSSDNDNFPFHVRTTQIDIMEQSMHGVSGENSIDRFTQRGYAPTHFAGNEPVGQNISVIAGSSDMSNFAHHGPGEKPPNYFALFGAKSSLQVTCEEIEFEDQFLSQSDSGISLSNESMPFRTQYSVVDRPSLALPPAGSASFLPLIPNSSLSIQHPSAPSPSMDSAGPGPPSERVERGIHSIELK